MDTNVRMSFIGSIVMLLVALAFGLGSLQIYFKAGLKMHESPALTPLMVSVALLVASLILCGQTLRHGGLRVRLAEAGQWFADVARKPYTRPTIIGLALMGIYVFVLMPRMPFWASSFIFMVAMLFFLRALRWWAILLTSAALVGAVFYLFQVLLRAPLP